MSPHLKDFYQRKLGSLFGVFNNKAYSQQRNFCERKVQSAKKVIKQSLQSRPGPQDEPLDRSLLETVLIMSAYVMNSTPYLTEENKELLAPIDSIAPWNGADVQTLH